MYSHILPHLWDLNNSCNDIHASALASTDGLIIATTLPQEMDEDSVAAISAGALVLGNHASEECSSGPLEQILIKCKGNCVVMTQAGKESILTVMTHPQADLDLIFSHIKLSAEKIGTLI